MRDVLSLVRSGRLLYQDDVGHDACGIGGVAARDGTPSREVVQTSLVALKAMEHRGGICGDAGDGAGLTCQLPQPFFKEEAKKLRLDRARSLKSEDRLAVGVVLVLDRDPAKVEAARASIRQVLSGGPCTWLGFRPVPTNDDALPRLARDTRPGAIDHVLLKVDGDGRAAERWLYRRRLDLRHRFARDGIDAFVSSLSSTLVSYKGLLTSPQFIDFYPDLHADGFEAGVVTFHRRYSTNTFPNWKLAQ